MRVRVREERGQAIALLAVAMVVLLGTAALTMDVGFAWYAKRQVQASADAAALAGAQELPDVANANATALAYYKKNKPDNMGSTPDPLITTRCAPASSFLCKNTTVVNTIQVTATATLPSWFGNVLGFDHFDVKGTATACQPCSSSPVDIMLVIDRTGSMCSPTGIGGSCTDLDNAKGGVQTLLQILDPTIDRVGLVAFPGYTSTDQYGVCGHDTQSGLLTINGNTKVQPGFYDVGPGTPTLTYLDDPLSNDFKTDPNATALNFATSPLVQHMRLDTDAAAPKYHGHSCIESMGSTSYSDALQVAKDELDKDGRPGVPHVIVFMTDGEANTGSFQDGIAGHGVEGDLDNFPTTGDDMTGGIASITNPGDAQPCHTAIDIASGIKADNVTIYTIGYALGAATACYHGVWGEFKGNTDTCHPIGFYGPTVTGVTAGHWQGDQGGNPCLRTLHPEQPAITSATTVAAIASPGNFYNKPNPGQLKTIFAAIAEDITSGTSRLIDDSWGTTG
jgi:hypothetical protein